MAIDIAEVCGNMTSEIITTLMEFYKTVNTSNEILGSIVIIAFIAFPFYIIYCLKNNHVAKTFTSMFGNNGG
ncbi:protein of unknown function [Moritella yayanosii]|uniref:Uncharacterized protein n=1 Tax=Moritella yayanosii TaxID=69539 RepID=A0A330LU60_9GAMM|nr:protein of unknown function [Moritella yayanosii]